MIASSSRPRNARSSARAGSSVADQTGLETKKRYRDMPKMEIMWASCGELWVWEWASLMKRWFSYNDLIHLNHSFPCHIKYISKQRAQTERKLHICIAVRERPSGDSKQATCLYFSRTLILLFVYGTLGYQGSLRSQGYCSPKDRAWIWFFKNGWFLLNLASKWNHIEWLLWFLLFRNLADCHWAMQYVIRPLNRYKISFSFNNNIF